GKAVATGFPCPAPAAEMSAEPDRGGSNPLPYQFCQRTWVVIPSRLNQKRSSFDESFIVARRHFARATPFASITNFRRAFHACRKILPVPRSAPQDPEPRRRKSQGHQHLAARADPAAGTEVAGAGGRRAIAHFPFSALMPFRKRC